MGLVRVIHNVSYERVYYKKRRGYGTDRRSYENSEKGVASGVISGYGTDRRSYENSEKGVARNTYSLIFLRYFYKYYYERVYRQIL